MTEQEMREAVVPTPESYESLAEYVRGLVEQKHDYGTCCYAMSMAAVAAFNLVASRLGVTGFQASCADMDILARTRGWKWGKILDYEKLLYPQYCTEEHFPSAGTLLWEHRVRLAELAKERLAEKELFASKNVVNHWNELIERGEQK